MLVWIVPAILGTVAALLLKWRVRWSSLGFATIAIVAGFVVSVEGFSRASERAPAYAAADSWSKLRIGMSVYTGGNTSGQAVCPTLAELYSQQRSNTSRRSAARCKGHVSNCRCDNSMQKDRPRLGLRIAAGATPCCRGFLEWLYRCDELYSQTYLRHAHSNATRLGDSACD